MITLKLLAQLMLTRCYNQANQKAYHGLAMELIFAGHSSEAFRCFAARLEAGDVTGAKAWAERIDT